MGGHVQVPKGGAGDELRLGSHRRLPLSDTRARYTHAAVRAQVQPWEQNEKKEIGSANKAENGHKVVELSLGGARKSKGAGAQNRKGPGAVQVSQH